MKLKNQIGPRGFVLAIIGLSLFVVGCGGGEPSAPNSTSKDQAANSIPSESALVKKLATSDGSMGDTIKPKPPISVDYKILGIPEIGQPLRIELAVSSSIADAQIQVNYRALDRAALSFMPSDNGDQSFKLASNNSGVRIITVVPQQEGRNIFTVTTNFETPDGIVSSSKAIAIQVGDLPPEKKINGTLTSDENGEAIISMQAGD